MTKVGPQKGVGLRRPSHVCGGKTLMFLLARRGKWKIAGRGKSGKSQGEAASALKTVEDCLANFMPPRFMLPGDEDDEDIEEDEDEEADDVNDNDDDEDLSTTLRR